MRRFSFSLSLEGRGFGSFSFVFCSTSPSLFPLFLPGSPLFAFLSPLSSLCRPVPKNPTQNRKPGTLRCRPRWRPASSTFCLIPEVPFTIPKLCAAVEAVLDRQGDCVVCVAEGAGQDLTRTGGGNGAAHGGATDASGNPILEDVGAFLKSAFKQGVPGCDCKYIGETYFVFVSGEREGKRGNFFPNKAREKKPSCRSTLDQELKMRLQSTQLNSTSTISLPPQKLKNSLQTRPT